jgi:tRNA nucleotidyltransferase/poly(A) polymerase
MPISKKDDSDESPYAGRWVARVRDRIVGQGATPDAARRAAKSHRPKDRIEIAYMHRSWSPPLADLISKLAALAPSGNLFLVGGALRDSLLSRSSHDYDFVVAGDSIGLARLVARALKADFFVLDQEFGAARVIVTQPNGMRDNLDFAGMRGSNIEADLNARDFTINAMALNVLDGTTLDPLHGATDLRAKVIRACSPKSLDEDPIRILRAVRLAAALGFGIGPQTRKAMRAAAHLLPPISEERKRDELFRMLGGQKPEACMRALEMLGVFPHLLPELSALKGVQQPTPHEHDVWDHTLSVMRHLGDILDLALHGTVEDANGMQASLLNLGIGRYRQQITEHFSAGLNPDRPLRSLLQFAALYHDVGKPALESRGVDGRIHFIGHEKKGADVAVERAVKLKLSNAEVEWLRVVITNHLRFFFLASRKEADGESPPRRSVYRFFRDGAPAGVELVLLGLADLKGARDHLLTEEVWGAWVSVARSLLENLWERPEEAVAPPRFVDGNDLMHELALPPGPAIGQLLEALREAQAAGDVTDRESSFAFARERTMGDHDT